MAARGGADFGDDGVDEVDGRFPELLQSRDPMRTTGSSWRPVSSGGARWCRPSARQTPTSTKSRTSQAEEKLSARVG